jgi:hypothetical protein
MTCRIAFAFGLTACSLAHLASAQATERLFAPTYYIAVSADPDVGGIVHVRGASNLPPGAAIQLTIYAQSGNIKSSSTCVSTGAEGLFKQDVQVSPGVLRPKMLYVRATFMTDLCKQSASVLRIAGQHGEFLGNDSHKVTIDEVRKGMTEGMFRNPQLFQTSGWYFGISDEAQIVGWR